MIDFFTAPQLELNGYCPSSDFDGDALTQSNVV
jgi:hypothetical protein